MLEILKACLLSVDKLIAAFSMLATVFAAMAAYGSWRLARKIQSDSQADEVLVAGELHHPGLRDIHHSWSVLTTTIFNKSKRKAVISGVRLLDSRGREVPATWSGEIDPYGNPLEGYDRLLGVVDSVRIYVRRDDGEPIASDQLEIHHSFSNSPLRVPFEIPEG